ncbi:DUF4365 domain-containing protein [Chamaesiphon sp. VAR_69_metabat_338]|uniref:DUF4365 domain-containing protein n=1 Tax=Chamaesiphon sp. VAR_69_metabat_338 TaxID=2964704 RepID=UPI00286E165F|nr:DUF4365 domain-containing protein [Chamaesiphon sp. VAR_69_metabat_338]
MTNISTGGLTLNNRKEEFSYSYINAITATAGYVCQVKPRGMDNAGIDLTIEVPGEISACLSPKLDAQVKCTSSDCIDENHINFNLNVKNYNRLINKRSLVPQALIVVLVHKDVDEWVKNTANPYLTELRASAYWISLKGHEPTENKSSITIKIPLSYRLSPEVLIEIMRKIAEGENL